MVSQNEGDRMSEKLGVRMDNLLKRRLDSFRDETGIGISFIVRGYLEHYMDIYDELKERGLMINKNDVIPKKS